MSTPVVSVGPVAEAVRSGLAAAASAGVQIRELRELAELDQVYRLYDSIWRPDPKNPPVTTELLRALTKAGNYVSGAYDGDELIGACVGFFGAPAERDDAQPRGRGFGPGSRAQCRVCVEAASAGMGDAARRGGDFVDVRSADPAQRLLQSRRSSRREPTEYLTNFYGFMHDGINSGDDTDRLLVRWELDAPLVAAAADRHPAVAFGRTVAAGNGRAGLRR